MIDKNIQPLISINEMKNLFSSRKCKHNILSVIKHRSKFQITINLLLAIVAIVLLDSFNFRMKTITPLSNNKATVISKINITRDGIDITYRSRIIVKHANKLAMEYYLPENGYLIKNLAAGEYYIHSITPGEGIMIKLPPEKTAFKVDSNNHIYYIGNIDVDLTGKAHSGMRLNGSSIGKGSTSDMIFFFIVVAGVIIANEIAAKKPGEQYINFYDDGNEIQEYFKKTSGDSLIVERSLMRAIE